jgi:outer membrane protein OmpA-like peptidoglycan-associated protein
MALGFLRDGQGDIALEVPISGRLDDPSFDSSDAVRQAVGGAIRGALLTTFNVLFPFGFIFGALGDGQSLPALPPVAFAPGLASLDARATAALDALAGVLADRPSTRLDVCGFAGPADLRALSAARGTDPRGQELVETLRRLFARATGSAPNAAGEDELRGLAEERARAVAQRLAERPGVDAARLFECRPVVETQADAAPRVELRF